MQNAAKVGGLVLLSGALAAGGWWALGRSFGAAQTVGYVSEVPDARGVATGTPVYVAGVAVGQVDSVTLTDANLARLDFSVRRDVSVPGGSTVRIPQSLVGLGNARVELVPGPGQPLPPGSLLPAGTGGAVDALLPEANETVKELNALLREARMLVGDQGLRDDIRQLLETTTATLKRYGGLAERLDGVVAQNTRTLSETLEQGALAAKDVRALTRSAREIVDSPTVRQEPARILAAVRQSVVRAEQLVASLDRTVNDPAIRRSLDNIDSLTAEGVRIAQDVKRLSESGLEIARQVETIAVDGKAASENIVIFTQKANELADGAKAIEDRVLTILDKVDRALGRSPGGAVPQVRASMDVLRSAEVGRFRTDFGVEVPVASGRVRAGLYDAFESNRLTLQYVPPPFGKLGYRYGVYAGKPGVGVDYALARNLVVDSDLWDINDPRLDVRFRYDFGNRLVGWLGIDHAFGKSYGVFGVGFRY
jgi:phospholipid/cholesterol/gamma-HCH transport system substrate-binding protein